MYFRRLIPNPLEVHFPGIRTAVGKKLECTESVRYSLQMEGRKEIRGGFYLVTIGDLDRKQQ